MLNFNYSISQIDGQFNGRYAFRSPRDHSTGVVTSYLTAIANKHPEAFRDKVIVHEFLHWKTFQKSFLGRALVGKRFYVRARFLKGDFDLVYQYYFQRTVYFYCAFRVHEEIVSELESKLASPVHFLGLAKVVLSKQQVKRVVASDLHAFNIFRSMRRSFMVLEFMIFFLLAIFPTREFGVQAYVNTEAGVKLQEVSFSKKGFGVFNAAMDRCYSTPGFFIRLMRRIAAWANIERQLGGLPTAALVDWAYIKYRAEIKCLMEIKNLERDKYYFKDLEEIVLQHIRFVVQYAGLGYNELKIFLIRKTILDCASDQECLVADVKSRLACLDREFLYFSYAHGN